VQRKLNKRQYPIRKQLRRTHKIREQMRGELHLSKHRLSNDNDWEYTFSNDGVKVSSHSKASKIQSNTRTYNIKNLAGKLGTQDRLKLMFPEVYPNANCRLFHHCVVEDNNHIWTCGSQY
jgi:hypothetical protein